MDINIEELLKMVEKENNDYKKQIYELNLQVDVLNERLAIQKVEFEEEKKALMDALISIKGLIWAIDEKLEIIESEE